MEVEDCLAAEVEDLVDGGWDGQEDLGKVSFDSQVGVVGRAACCS